MHYRNPVMRLLKASSYSLQGLAYALRHEQAFQYEAGVLVVLCAVLLVLEVPAGQFLVLTGAWLAVMCLELVNSAVEKAFDLITRDFHPLVKAGKDMLSASVFLAVCFNIFLWAVAIISHPN